MEFDTLGLSQKRLLEMSQKKNLMKRLLYQSEKLNFHLRFKTCWKKHRVLWTTISKLVFDITMKAREEVRSKKKVDTNISVDWRATENVMALYNNYAGRFLQYISIAMANGPLAYGSESEDSIPQVDEVKSSNVTTTMALKTNQDKALETLQILAHIPQMKLHLNMEIPFKYF